MMFRITTVVTLIGGTMFLMWLGEQITARGIGNGVSLIIMAGIVAQLPTTLVQVFESGRTGTLSPLLILAWSPRPRSSSSSSASWSGPSAGC